MIVKKDVYNNESKTERGRQLRCFGVRAEWTKRARPRLALFTATPHRLGQNERLLSTSSLR